MFDTYVDTVECPACGVSFEASVHDSAGDRIMRIFRPHDLVQELRDSDLRKISEEVRCPDCDHEFVVDVSVVHGVVGHFDEPPPDVSDPASMLKFMERSVLASSQRRSELEHMLDVVRLAVRLWTGDPTLEIGEDWHLNEPGLPRLHKGMSCDQFLRSVKTYLDASHRSGDGR